MGDVITWSKINKLKRTINGWTQVRGKIKNANFTHGLPADSMVTFNAMSTESGIEITYEVNASGKDFLKNRTKGVMVRYSDNNYPQTREQGVLAFDDKDVFEPDVNGVLSAKRKKKEIVGFTKNKTYYFTAFPYTNGNVWNEQMGGANTVTCQYVGNLGSLRVAVSADKIVMPLNYTLTLTGNGKTLTKSGNGNSEILFSGLAPGSYTLKASDVSRYKTPKSQTITLQSSEVSDVSIKYVNNFNLQTATWDEIETVCKQKRHKEIFYVGEYKDVIANNGKKYTIEIAGFDHDDLVAGGKAPITFVMRYASYDYYRGPVGSFKSEFPKDIQAHMKQVKKKTFASINSLGALGIKDENKFDFLLSETEVGFNVHGAHFQGNQYPIFTGNGSRIKRSKNGDGAVVEWYLRTEYPPQHNTNGYKTVNSDGTEGWEYWSSSSTCVVIGFCV